MATDQVGDAGLYAPGAARPWRSEVIAAGGVLVALALLALVLAYWGWRWFGPAPVAPPRSAPQGDLLQPIGAARVFGASAAPTRTAEPGVTSGDLRLLGVFAGQDGRGYALFRGARGALFAGAGTEVVSGVRLESVRPDGVTLVENGTRRELALRPATPPAKARAVATASAKSPNCAAPAGFTGQIVRLNAELLTGMLKAPDTWKALVQPGGGGLIVRDQSGFAGMMGLRSGDRLERANGIALALPDDVAASVLQPLTRSQSVAVSGTRDGKTQQWLYVNAGACPS